MLKFLALTMIQMFAFQIFAQLPYKVVKPLLPPSFGQNPFFLMECRTDSTKGFRRVVHLYHQDQRFLTLMLSKLAHQKNTMVTQVLIHDSTLVQEFPHLFRNDVLLDYTVKVVDTSNMEAEFPVEYQKTFTNNVRHNKVQLRGQIHATQEISTKPILDKEKPINSLLNDVSLAIVSDTFLKTKDSVMSVTFLSKGKSFMEGIAIKQRDSIQYTNLQVRDSSLYKRITGKAGQKVAVVIDKTVFELQTKKHATSPSAELIPILPPQVPVVKRAILTGEVATEAVFGNNRYTNQTLPASYIRQQVNVTTNVGPLPVHGYWSASTELSGISKLINYYGISFDFNQLGSNLTQQKAIPKLPGGLTLNSELSSEISDQELLKKLEIKRIERLTDSLKVVLGNKEYTRRVKTDSLSLVGVDTSNLSYGQKINYNRLEGHKERLVLLHKYEQLRKQLEQEERKSLVKKFMRSDYKVSHEQLKKNGIGKFAGFWINSIRKLEIGASSPQYTDLTLSQINLLGLNTEMGLGYFYLAFTAGKENNFGLMHDMRNNNASVVAGRFGLGTPEKLLFSINVVKARRDNRLGSDTGLNNVRDNLVTSVSLNYNKNNQHLVYLEYAKSLANLTPEDNVETDLIFGRNNASSSAIIAGANGRLGKGGNYQFETRYTEPYYIALGSPNLRQDHFKIMGRVRQSLFKSRLSLTTGYQFDRDNLSLTKPTFSSQNKLTLNARIKVSKNVQFIIGFIPVWTDVIYQPTGTFYSTYMGLSTVSVIHQKKYRAMSNMFNVTYQGSHLQTSVSEKLTTSSLHYVNALNTLLLMQYNLSVSGTGTVYTSSQTDSSYGYSAGVSFKKQLTKYQLSYGLGTRYQVDRITERRYLLSAEFSIVLPYRIYCSLKAEQHFVHQHSEVGGTYNRQQFSILITKRF